METMLHEIELETKKVIQFRKCEVSDYEMASQLAAAQSNNDSAIMFSMKLQKEMLKMLIVSIDGKKLQNLDKEKLSEFLSIDEYMAASEFAGSLMGKSKILRKGLVSASGGKSPG